MPSREKREFRYPISTEKQMELDIKKQAVETERFQIALRMMLHNETDFKISVYTQLSMKKVKHIRDNLLDVAQKSVEKKNKAMKQSLIMCDPKPLDVMLE